MCDKAVNDFLPVLKFVPDWFVASKIIKKLHNAIFADDILIFDEDSRNVTFSSYQVGIHSVDLNINIFNKNDPGTIIHVRLMA